MFHCKQSALVNTVSYRPIGLASEFFFNLS